MRLPAQTSGSSTCHRTGSVGILLLLLFVVFMLIFAWVFNVGYIWAVHAELRRTGDASALAGTLALVDDVHLKGYLYGKTPTGMEVLIDQAHDRAKALALLNPVIGTPFVLMDNPDNLPEGDIVFGFVDNSTNVNFIPATNVNDPNNLDLINVNAVKIRVLKLQERGNELKLFYSGLTGHGAQDIGWTSLAMMDRDVVGFKSILGLSVPLAPLAFLADYSLKDQDSWNAQIEDLGNTSDDFKFDPVTKTFSKGSDGLPEFEAFIDYDQKTKFSNTAFLFIGIPNNDYVALNGQILTGITPTQLMNFGQPFQLDPGSNTLTVPGTVDGTNSNAEKKTLQDNLNLLRINAEVRIWPLYCSLDKGGDPVICGFVAGRVVEVEANASKSKGKCKPPGKCQKSGSNLRILVQPTMIATSTAVTNFNQRNAGGISILNKYISKVRLVDE